MRALSKEGVSASLIDSYGRPPLLDGHGRVINYVRLAITDRCNLRCRYCMPDGGVDFVPHKEILSFEELGRLVAIFSEMGMAKVRVTGGEPFARKDSLNFLRHISGLETVKSFFITTNGVATGQYIPELKEMGIAGINLSLDTLDRQRFENITGKDKLDVVLATMNETLNYAIPLKTNTVVLDDTCDEDIYALGMLASSKPVTVRFIEKMPFSGTNGQTAGLVGSSLLERLYTIFPTMKETEVEHPSTARLFELPGFVGKIGIIEGFSRHFCATCNKLRITPQGIMKTCLYDNGVLDLKALLRGGVNDDEIKKLVKACILTRPINGHVTEKMAARENQPSMASIGG